MYSGHNYYLIQKNQLLLNVLESVHEIALILNCDREIIYYNSKFKDFAKKHGLKSEHGLKFGDAFRCIYAIGENGKCGATEFCKFCGGNKVINVSSNGDKAASSCHIAAENGNAFELAVSASQLSIEDQVFTLFCINDISAESRKKMLEKIFFHDVNNIINVITLMMELIAEDKENEDEPALNKNFEILNASMMSLRNEIDSQHLITLAEKDDIMINKEKFNIKKLMDNISEFFEKTMSGRAINQNCKLRDDEQMVYTDPTLLKRVIINTLKNACEASLKDEPVYMTYEKHEDDILISINNTQVMTEEIKRSVFKRSFSTKGTGRGLGTYSMRLLTERYLGGNISFTSEPGEGTTFFIKLPIS